MQGDPVEIAQESEIWPYEQMVYTKPRTCLRKWDAQTLLGFWNTNGSSNLGQTIRPNNSKKKKEKKKKKNLQNCGLSCPGWLQSQIERKKVKRRISTWTLLGKWKKLWNMKVTVIPIVIGALGTVTKGLIQELEDLKITGRVETFQTTALLRSARILRRVLEIWGDLLSLKLQWETFN